MGLARKLVLSCALALVAAALAASTASAQESAIEAVNEDLGGHCNCFIHASGELMVTVHVIGVEQITSACVDEFFMDLNEDFTGNAEGYESFSDPTHECRVLNCNGVGETAQEALWPLSHPGETGPNEGHVRFNACFDRTGFENATGVHCSLEAHFEEHPTVSHKYFFLITNQPCGNAEIDAVWGTEVDSEEQFDMEIVHP